MKKGLKYTQLSQRDFDLIKNLLANNFTKKKIHELTGRSSSTIQYIKKSTTLEEYKRTIQNYVAGYTAKKKMQSEAKEKEESKPNGTIPTPTPPIDVPFAKMENKLDMVVVLVQRLVDIEIEKLEYSKRKAQERQRRGWF